MNDDRRALLEALAFGDDPKVTPSDRLRALELLRAEHGGQGRPDFSDLTDAELDAAEDADLSAALVDLLRQELDGIEPPHLTAELFPAGLPLTVAALAAELQRRAEARARELADSERLDAEVERRARELAERMYQDRAFRIVHDGPETASPPD